MNMMDDQKNVRTYEFQYLGGSVGISIDLDKFTEKEAKDTLDFFSWDYPYDKDNDLIDEAAKKYGMECMSIATTRDYNLTGVISVMNNSEGFYEVDGSNGIVINHVEKVCLDDPEFLEMEIL